ncbi:iron complex outermembrane receptor protein [Pseudoduganella lurida]|uniref:Iron complex outermembrane receptor protein n=1 Tax=Pseudoduganella lurida TaxID=1036180 RepID=A0A562R9Z1_9BURK|nr:TonB-dependent receptor [Pseudoduganella lurida]TWI65384.1 iron complex outermembrane receptor protein [Pseudoduganella lurida]
MNAYARAWTDAVQPSAVRATGAPLAPRARRRRRGSAALAAACAGAMLQLAPAAFAQEPAVGQSIQRVIVTGSNLKRIEAETAMPVQVIRHEEITRIGVNTVKELLDTLTSSDRQALSDAGGSNSFAGGASAVALRGLGKQSTLVLLNSRRVAPYALADYNEVFTNLDALPLDAVDRVEILRNGGSAVYGSDAVAGVVNIITRSDYEGVQARASHNQSTQNSEFHESTAAITGGFGNLATDRWNVLANIEFYRRKAVNWRQAVDDINPDYGDAFSAVAPGSGLMFGSRGAPSTFSFPGNIIGQGALPGCATVNAAGLCVYDRFAHFQAQPAAHRVNALVSGKYQFSDGLEAFGELLLSRTKTDYSGAQTTYGSTTADAIWGNPATGEQRSFTYRFLPPTHPLNELGEEAELRYRFADDPSYRHTVSDQYRALTGLRGTWRDYDWETALGIMGSKTKDRSRGGFFSLSGFQQVIGATDATSDDPLLFNRAYRLGELNTPEVVNTLFPENGYDGKITQTFVDGKITGEVAKLGGRGVNLALGGEVRHEKFEINPSANLLAGDIVSNGAATSNASRTNASVFTEANLPLLDKLELIGAVRLDKFKDVKAHASPKLAARWEATPRFLLRGTFEKGFRAPNLTESAQSSKFAFDNGQFDPKRCDQAQALANDLRAQSDALPASDPNKALLAARADIVEGNECATGIASTVRNNPGLKPETSKSTTLGFAIEPVSGTSFTLDAWRIERKDEIGVKTTAELLAAEDSLPPGTVIRQSLDQDRTFTAAERQRYGVTAGPLSATTGMFENTAQTVTRGVDLSLGSRVDTPLGRLNVTGNATYLFEYKEWAPTRNGTGGWGDNLAGRWNYPKTVANLTATLSRGDFAHTVRSNFRSSTTLQGDYYDDEYSAQGCEDRGWTPAQCRVASFVRWDYNLSYSGIRNLTLSLFVRNVLNHRPPLDLYQFNSSGGGVIPQDTDDVQGRSVRITAEYKFK